MTHASCITIQEEACSLQMLGEVETGQIEGAPVIIGTLIRTVPSRRSHREPLVVTAVPPLLCNSQSVPRELCNGYFTLKSKSGNIPINRPKRRKKAVLVRHSPRQNRKRQTNDTPTNTRTN